VVVAQWGAPRHPQVNSGDPGAYWQMLTQKRTVDRKRVEIAGRIATLVDPAQPD
jgi:hypothetical protein